MKCAVKNNLILLLAFLLCGCGGYLPAEKTRWQVNKGEQYSWYPPDETVLSQRRVNQLWLDNLTHEIETLFINHATISDQELHIYETINKTDPQINTMKLNYPKRRDEIGVLSDDIKSMSEDLKNQINEIRGFAADVSHELKNPLASLKNSNEVLVDDKIPHNKKKLLLKNMQKDIERINILIDDISKYAVTGVEIEDELFTNFDINNFLEELLESYKDNEIHIIILIIIL